MTHPAPFVDVNAGARRAIDAARLRHGLQAPPGKIIAGLTLGVWRYLTTSAHEKTLWVPHLHHAFPPKTERSVVDKAVGGLHELRNRAAHWEPLLNEPVARRMDDLLMLTALLSPDLAAHIRHTSQVTGLLNTRP